MHDLGFRSNDRLELGRGDKGGVVGGTGKQHTTLLLDWPCAQNSLRLHVVGTETHITLFLFAPRAPQTMVERTHSIHSEFFVYRKCITIAWDRREKKKCGRVGETFAFTFKLVDLFCFLLTSVVHSSIFKHILQQDTTDWRLSRTFPPFFRQLNVSSCTFVCRVICHYPLLQVLCLVLPFSIYMPINYFPCGSPPPFAHEGYDLCFGSAIKNVYVAWAFVQTITHTQRDRETRNQSIWKLILYGCQKQNMHRWGLPSLHFRVMMMMMVMVSA